MRLERLQKVASYATLAVSLGALGLAGVVGPVLGPVLGVALVVSWFWEAPRVRVGRFRWLWNGALLVFIGYTAVVIGASPQQLMQPAVHLVLVLVVVKLFQRVSARDYIQLYALSFLMMAVSTVLSESLEFGLVFAVYLIATTVGLSLCHVLGAAEQAEAGEGVESIELSGRTLGLVTGMAVLLVGSSGVFFLILPRISLGGPQLQERRAQSVVGFSDTVTLEGHGAIGLDDRKVMRVEMERPVDAPYWRGLSFDRFDGLRWARSSAVSDIAPLPLDDEGRYALEGELDEAAVRQRIELEPLGADVLPGLTSVRALRFGPDEVGRSARIDGGDAWHRRSAVRELVVYDAWSVPEAYDRSREVEEAPIPLEVAQRYMQLPVSLSMRARRLSRDVVEAQGARTALEKAEALESFLSSSYDYSLNLPKRGPSPVDDFLFEQRWGHCEYFSTSMVMMLRAVGVAARNVNGFNGGEWNDVGKYYVVRRLHAHSWVEAYIPGVGWLTFDPTPPSSIPSQRAETSGTVDGFGAYVDVMRQRWQKWVMNFSLEEQLAFLRSGLGGDGELTIGNVLSGIWEGLRGYWLGWLVLIGLQLALVWGLRRSRYGLVLLLGTWAAGLAVVVLFWGEVAFWPTVVALLVPGYVYWKMRISALWSRHGSREKRHPLSALFEDVLTHLARWEVLEEKPAYALPGRVSRRLRGSGEPVLVEVGELVRRYGEARFGGAPMGASELRAMRREWTELKRRLKRWGREQARRTG